MSRAAVVVTTIQHPTPALRAMAERAAAHGMDVVIAGDTKTPSDFHLEGATYLSVDDQLASPFELARKLPKGHYARKNIGYLHAIASGATAIFETDDDNVPLETWAPRAETVDAVDCINEGWVNVYRHYTDEPVWPRGFPLESIRCEDAVPRVSGRSRPVRAPIQQGLANGSPDVDAVWRLTQDRDITFRDAPSLRVAPGAWSPFNSQSTWWFPEAFPLLYLPSFCSFRMTDIWRSFVAQRCLWAMGHGVVFHGAEMRQERNEHDLLRDFEQEVPGYLGNGRLAAVLEGVRLESGPSRVTENVRICYESLVNAGVFPAPEIALVDAWSSSVASNTEARK